MDVCGRFNNEPGFSMDAFPSTSQHSGFSQKIISEPAVKTKSKLNPPPVKAAKEESASLGVIAVLLKTLMETVFRFKEPEEKALLNQICKTISEKNPETKLEIGEILEVYYEVDEANNNVDSAVAELLKKHAQPAPEPVIPNGQYDGEMEVDALPTTAHLNASKTTTGDGKGKAPQEKPKKDLKPELTCKVCLDNQVAVTFVPCGHLVTCVSCTAALFECPVCRAHIRGTIRTYI